MSLQPDGIEKRWTTTIRAQSRGMPNGPTKDRNRNTSSTRRARVDLNDPTFIEAAPRLGRKRKSYTDAVLATGFDSKTDFAYRTVLSRFRKHLTIRTSEKVLASFAEETLPQGLWIDFDDSRASAPNCFDWGAQKPIPPTIDPIELAVGPAVARRADALT